MAHSILFQNSHSIPQCLVDRSVANRRNKKGERKVNSDINVSPRTFLVYGDILAFLIILGQGYVPNP
ncbi:hypothetical protein DERF_002797 [Dermatophagoides farinae]|uniref:Uncharacterized protein n=1 Tax=Dermatophagoides farinae TaxID=6954 RepID=A0A922ICC7_DERFA|nr:hypothetical protein DERF_002797 [Dermatophagoides farinae]